MDTKEKRTRHWVLQMCHVNKRYGGVSHSELYEKKHKEISYQELELAIKTLIDDKLISLVPKKGSLNPPYDLTEDGKKALKKLNSSPSEALKILSMLPPEYELRYRLYNIERFFTHSFFFILFATLTFLAINQKYVKLSLLFIFLTYAFFPFAMGYFIRIIVFSLNQMLNLFFGRTYNLMDKYSKGISSALVVFLVILALGFIATYSWRGMFFALGGIIISLIFKEAHKNIRFARDKIQIGIDKFKKVFKID